MKNKLIRLAHAAVLGLASLVLAPAAHADVFRSGTVEAFDNDTRTFFLTAGDHHAITVEGDGFTDLDFYLYDPSGQLIGTDTDETDFTIFYVAPWESGRYTLVIVNRDDDFNEYDLSITP